MLLSAEMRLVLALMSVMLLGAAKLPSRTQVDWKARILVTVGAAAADLRAPGPDIARIAAARQARERADEKLRQASAELAGVKASDERLAKPLAEAKVKTTYSSDGSVEVELSLPLAVLEKALSVEVKK
jgi:hypothetical protein